MKHMIIQTQKTVYKVNVDDIYYIQTHPTRAHTVQIVTEEASFNMVQNLSNLENQYGEITCFNIINKCYAGSPLHRCDLEKYINTLWFSPALENNHMAPRDYTIEHNTKVIIRAVSGVTNKEYKQYLFEITRPYYCTTQSYRQKEQDKAKYLFGNLNDITPYKFDETILYRLLGYIHRYKKTIEVLEQPYHKAEHNTILEYMVYIIKHLSAEGKLKKVK